VENWFDKNWSAQVDHVATVALAVGAGVALLGWVLKKK
jgi:hypothetical protein